jgi:Carboxypeptidase regulatory-like domain
VLAPKLPGHGLLRESVVLGMARGLAVAALLLGSVAANAPGGRIIGYVSSAGAPVSSAQVRLVDVISGAALQTTRSDKDGRFSFSGVGSGTYGVNASAPGGRCAFSNALSLSDTFTIFVHLVMSERELCSGFLRFAEPSR